MILLDTCAVIWDALNDKRLPAKAKQAIDNADRNNTLLLADISLWEIAMLIERKRLELEETASTFIRWYLQARSIRIQPITPEIATLAVQLSSEINGDPADRLIAATAITQQAQLITGDRNLLKASIIPAFR